MTFAEGRNRPLNESQIAAREEIAKRHGAEFDVYSDGKSQYVIPTGDHDKPARRDHEDGIREAIMRDDRALDDGAPDADW